MSVKIAKADINEQGYLILEFFQEDITLTLEEVTAGWQIAHDIAPLYKNNVYLKTAKWSLLDKEARAFVIKEIKTWPAVAIHIHNLGQKIMGNFALNIAGKSKNIKIFDKEEDAVKWLLDRKIG